MSKKHCKEEKVSSAGYLSSNRKRKNILLWIFSDMYSKQCRKTLSRLPVSILRAVLNCPVTGCILFCAVIRLCVTDTCDRL